MEYVWAVAQAPYAEDGHPELFVLPRDSANDVAEIVRLLSECATWGDLRREASGENYEKIAGLAGYSGFADASMHLLIGQPIPGSLERAQAEFESAGEPPADGVAFNPEDIGAVSDGDYPPDPRYLMALHLPADLIDANGELYETNFSGTFAELPAAAASSVVEALVVRGHTCTEDPDLINYAVQDWYTQRAARK